MSLTKVVFIGPFLFLLDVLSVVEIEIELVRFIQQVLQPDAGPHAAQRLASSHFCTTDAILVPLDIDDVEIEVAPTWLRSMSTFPCQWYIRKW